MSVKKSMKETPPILWDDYSAGAREEWQCLLAADDRADLRVERVGFGRNIGVRSTLIVRDARICHE